jgi:hypothetical protein
MARALAPQPTAAIDRALRRVLVEIHDGLRHGFFEFTLTCETVGQERRRLILKAGKSHQFLISKEECVRPTELKIDPCNGGDDAATPSSREGSSR